MGRAGTFGAPLVGNEFAILPAKSVAVALPAEPRPEFFDESLLAQIDVEIKSPVQSRRQVSRLSKFLLLALFAVAAVVIGWAALSPRLSTITLSVTPQAATTVPAADLSSQMLALESQKINLTVGDKNIPIQSNDIEKWLSTDITSDSAKKIIVNQDAVRDFLNDLVQQYTKQPLSKIVVNRADGTTAVIAEGADGTKMNIDEAFGQITNNLLSGKGMNIKMPIVAAPYQTLTTNDFDKLLEVNITTHRMFAYEKGNVVKTFLVTAGAPATPTPIGQFHILQKKVTDDMRGYNPNGSKYFQPNVKWVNYFDNSGDAIHGNDWRPASIFGNVNTSHGCVGINDDDAHWVFDWAPAGTSVVTHT